MSLVLIVKSIIIISKVVISKVIISSVVVSDWGRSGLASTNALAYSGTVVITTVKSFIVDAQR